MHGKPLSTGLRSDWCCCREGLSRRSAQSASVFGCHRGALGVGRQHEIKPHDGGARTHRIEAFTSLFWRSWRPEGPHGAEQERRLRSPARTWFAAQLDSDPQRLVFVSESGVSTKMARLRSRARQAGRCRADVPHGH